MGSKTEQMRDDAARARRGGSQRRQGVAGASSLDPAAAAALLGETYNPDDAAQAARLRQYSSQVEQQGNYARAGVEAAGVANPYAAAPGAGTYYDNSQNYTGIGADGRQIERVGRTTLDPNAYRIGGYDESMARYGALEQQAGALANAAQGRTSVGDAFRDAQRVGATRADVAQTRGMLLDSLTNPGRSEGEIQARQSSDMAASNAIAMARSGRGFGGAGGAANQAAQAGAAAQAAGGAQAAALRAQEANARRQMLGNVAGMDVGRLGQEQQFYTAGAQAALQERGANDAYQAQQQGLGLQSMSQANALAAQQQAALAEQQRAQAELDYQTNKSNAEFSNYDEPTQNNAGAILSGIGSAVGGIALMASDIRNKTMIKDMGNGGAAGMLARIGRGQSGSSGLPQSPFGPASSGFVRADSPMGQMMGWDRGMQNAQAGGMAAGAAAKMAGPVSSDRESKTKIRDLEGKNAALMSALEGAQTDATEAINGAGSAREYMPNADAFKPATSNSYEYKDPEAFGAAPGKHVGPMSQDLRHIPGVVQTGPDGRDVVDAGRLALVNASATGELARELEDIKRQQLAAIQSAGGR